MRRRAVDNLTLERWRALDAVGVLEKLGCYMKVDSTYEPVSSRDTQRYHISVNGRDFELLVRGPKFYDTRLARGGGGAVDLAMHLHSLDFKDATGLLRSLGI